MSGLNSSMCRTGFGVVRHGSVSEEDGSDGAGGSGGMDFLNRARHAEAKNILWRVGKKKWYNLLQRNTTYRGSYTMTRI